MITFQVEPLAKFYQDGQALFPLHYRELAMFQEQVKLDLDVGKYERLEKEGAVLICTAREDGRLVGYHVTFLLPHLHYASAGKMAHTDMYYVLPEHRSGVGARLLLFVEDEWRRAGAAKAYISCKVRQDHTAFFRALGFELSDYMFVKMLR